MLELRQHSSVSRQRVSHKLSVLCDAGKQGCYVANVCMLTFSIGGCAGEVETQNNAALN